MKKGKIKFYGTKWCGDCFRALGILKAHRVEYQWIDIDKDLQAEQIVKQLNHGFRSVPTIIFEDGSILVEPSSNDLEQKLNLLSQSLD
jgi:mycoredoxin